VAVIGLALWARREDNLRAAWGRVLRNGVAMAAATVLAAFVVIGLLDSLHYRARLEGKPGEPARYAVEVNSVLDALLAPLRTRPRKPTRRRWRPVSTPRKRSKHRRRAARLPAPEARRRPPRRRTSTRMGPTSSSASCSVAAPDCCCGSSCILVAAAEACAQQSPCRGSAAKPVAWGAVLTLLPMLVLGGAIAALAGGYHVFGTDKVGQDVLYQVLKSVRTASSSALVTTLVMLPLAVLLGILAGYVRRLGR
jgi:peptide/nickel transport system permease protein